MAASRGATSIGSSVRLTSSGRLYGFGAVLLIALTICRHNFGRTGLPFLAPLVFAGLVYLFAIREFFHTTHYPRRVVLLGLALAGIWNLLFLFTPPRTDDDVHRYLWDGRIQRLGYNPYLLVPNDPAVSSLHTAETRTLNNPEVPSPYPPGAQLFFRAVTAIHESIFALKLALVLCEAAIVFVLLDVLRRTRKPSHWVLAFAWHPLLATEVAGSGHVDILGVLLLLISVAGLLRRWSALAAISFGLSVAVKFVPIVLVPLCWKRVRLRDAVLAVAVFGLLYVPFLNHRRVPFGSLGTYVQRFRFNDPIFAALERVTTPQIAALFALLVGVFTAMWLRRRATELSLEEFAWPIAAFLFCAPVVYPWYLLWLLPFLGSASTLPLLVWTVSIVPTYYVWHLRTLGQQWVVPDWIVLVEYGAVALTAIVASLRTMRFSMRSSMD
jgi:alpha-1,6-mannosyltransferase